MNNTNIDQRTPEQVILEKLSSDGGFLSMWTPVIEGQAKYVNRKLTERYGSVEKAAEKAAEWFNGQDNSVFYCHSVWIFTEDSALCNPVTGQTRWLFRPIELIAEALKAGWEG